jgi:hypothetical protein
MPRVQAQALSRIRVSSCGNVIEFVNYHKWEGKIKIVDPDSR